jgi:hypothetical protein
VFLAAVHGLAPWSLPQQVGLILFIFVLPKEPKQALLLSLVFKQLYLHGSMDNASSSKIHPVCCCVAQGTKPRTAAVTGVFGSCTCFGPWATSKVNPICCMLAK